MKKITIALFSLSLVAAFPNTSSAQTENKKTSTVKAPTEPSEAAKAWKTLSKITFKKEYDEIMGFKVDKPVFSKEVLELEGKVIKIKGYIIPVEGYKSHKEFVFSAFPYNMCFFCGGAGPETVMEVVASEPVKYSAEAVTLEGKLETNSDDINRLIYTLTDAVLIKE
ncbi:hypothetical protein OAU10_02005 [Saprospiraceae bacterium]|nr:hypothetical protein [Saprospiraceae bacterium]MDC3253613.1 hypothetical protein [bacterium]